MNRTIPFAIVAASLALLTGQAWSAPVLYTASLVPEAPGATGSGSVQVTVDDVLNTIAVEADFLGLSGITTVAHIHCCTAVPGAGTSAWP